MTLILTHRCNLACGYCYAGEHVRRDMDAATLDRAVDLLFADGADRAQLSFFGGEPFLAFDAMRRAVARAERHARAAGARLAVQCTTNATALGPEQVAFVREHGIRCTVSIDGVRAAHDLNRPRAGGGSSYDQVRAGLRRLVRTGCAPDALMVISPQTVPYVYASVSELWAEGVGMVRANLVLDAPWTAEDRDELREQLLAVGWELLARRTRGEAVAFEPFERAMRPVRRKPAGGRRPHVVVATSGHLYPCAPMVGEDRDDGREAALRVGHLDDGAPAIARRAAACGVGCDDGRGCACAAYLETGDPGTPGPNGRWFGAVCGELGAAIADALARGPYPPRAAGTGGAGRRPFVIGVAAALAGLAAGGSALLRAGLPGCKRPRDGVDAVVARGEMAGPGAGGGPGDDPLAGVDLDEVVPTGATAFPPAGDDPPDGATVGEDAPPLPGELRAPDPAPAVEGDLAAPPEPAIDLRPRGQLRRPAGDSAPRGPGSAAGGD